MRKKIISKNIIAVGSALLFALGTSAQGLTPLYPQMDCGEMLYQTPSTYVVQFKNTSFEPLEIKKVDTGCGCTTANYTKGLIQPNQIAQIGLTFDCNALGHFDRNIRVFASSAGMTLAKSDSTIYSDVLVKGVVVVKKIDFTGDYPYNMGSLLTDNDYLLFDDVNKGQRFMQEIHIVNNSNQNVQPVLLRQPPYISSVMIPVVLPPKQKGIMRIMLNSDKLRDYGLNQTIVFLGKNSSDKASAENMINISAVLLPPAVSQDDVNRPFAAKLSLSKDYIDMTPLREKPKNKDVITITNNGQNPLEIQKLQLFTTGVNVKLNKQTIEPGGNAKLEVLCKAKDLSKLHVRPRILMITNDPDHQKVVIEVKK